MAKGDKKNTNRARARAVRQQKTETGQSYTTCLREQEAARAAGPAGARPTKLSSVFEVRRFPLPMGSSMAAVTAWGNQQVQDAMLAMAEANAFTDAVKQVAEDQAAMAAMVSANPFAEAVRQITEQQDVLRAMAAPSPFAEAVKQMAAKQEVMRAMVRMQLNPLGQVMSLLNAR
jgi:hypothetical protein